MANISKTNCFRLINRELFLLYSEKASCLSVLAMEGLLILVGPDQFTRPLCFVYDVRRMTTAVQKAPRITPDDAARIAANLYGLNVFAAPLPSERDQNFVLCSAPSDLQSPNTDRHERFVLKIANSAEAFEFLELQNQLIQFLTDRKIALEFPRIVRAKTGEDIATIKGENGDEHFVRLLTWLDGVCLAQAEPHDRKLLSSLGRALAQMDAALADFSHPAAHRSFYWDLRNAAMARELIGLLPELSPAFGRTLLCRMGEDRLESFALQRHPQRRERLQHSC